jgi:hypothetical protein
MHDGTPHQAIMIIGGEEPADATYEQADHFDELFVVARAIPEETSRWVVDDERSAAAARERLRRTLARLRARGVRASGTVGDANAARACADARALFSAAAVLA